MALVGTSNEEKIWNFLYSKLNNAYGTAGLMGNLYAESGLKPNNLENLCEQRLKENGKSYNTDSLYTAAIDDGTIKRAEFLNPLPGKQYGYGLAQWTSPSRKAGLYDLVKSKNVSISDLETQLEFLINELSKSYSSVLTVLKSASSIREASDIVLIKFECPADISTAVKVLRANYGQVYYDKFALSNNNITTGGNTIKVVIQAQTANGKTKISNSGHDENNKYSGGSAGDNTGGEWQVISWYNRPWNCVLRHPDENVRLLLAYLAEKAALNNKIGYDQYQRNTYWTQLQKVGYDPSKITTACESDCSAGVIANTKAVGYLLGISALQKIGATYTGNMRSAYKSAGFQVLTASKYLTSSEYLLPGDILLNDVSHTATNLTPGIKVSASTSINVNTQNMIDKSYLSIGDSGSNVKTMQTMLIKCGYSCGSAGADGDFGSGTLAALKAFQKENGLTVDGLYGTSSKTKLTELYTQKTTNSNTNKLNENTKWIGIVNADKLNVRTWAGSENPTCSFSPLNKGTKVYVCDSVKDYNGNIWYYIKYNNKYGFVSSAYVKEENISSVKTSNNKVDYAESYSKSLSGTYKTTAKLNLRTGAGTNKDILCVIPKGAKVSCYGYYTSLNEVKWYFVSYNSYTGFVSCKYLEK